MAKLDVTFRGPAPTREGPSLFALFVMGALYVVALVALAVFLTRYRA